MSEPDVDPPELHTGHDDVVDDDGRRRRTRRRLSLVLWGLVAAGFVVRGVFVTQNARHDHAVWAVGIAVVGTFVLVAGLVWFLDGAWQRQAARVRRAHPHAWVAPMSRDRSVVLLYLDDTTVQLLGRRGRVRRRYDRSDLVSADVGPIEFPAVTRTGLRLRFRDGVELDLLTTRRGGLASSEPDARSACDYLQAHG